MSYVFLKGVVSLFCLMMGLSLIEPVLARWEAEHTINEYMLLTGFASVLFFCFAYFSFRSMFRGRANIQINIDRDRW